ATCPCRSADAGCAARRPRSAPTPPCSPAGPVAAAGRSSHGTSRPALLQGFSFGSWVDPEIIPPPPDSKPLSRLIVHTAGERGVSTPRFLTGALTRPARRRKRTGPGLYIFVK